MKKICYVSTVPITLKMFVLPVVRRIRAHTDWDISVICDEDEAFAESLPEGIHYIPIPMKRGISLGGIGAMLKMYRVFRREKFDLVQYSTPNASLYAALAAWLARIPTRLYCQWGIAYVGFRGVKRTVFKCVEKLVCTLSTWIEPDSFGNLCFSHAEGLYPERKGSVVWNGSASGVDLSKFDISQKEGWRKEIRARFGIGEDAVVLGFVGRITGDKGVNELFAAFQKVLANHPQAYLMLVGNMEKSDSVEQALYEWAQREPHVLFCGYTNVVEQFLSAMDIYLLPSYREGFGSVVIEAEAMGLPVIVSDIPGPTDAMLPGETGLVVPVKNVDALVAAMETLLQSEETRAAMGEKGREFAVKRFDQRILCDKIMEDRKQLLEKAK